MNYLPVLVWGDGSGRARQGHQSFPTNKAYSSDQTFIRLAEHNREADKTSGAGRTDERMDDEMTVKGRRDNSTDRLSDKQTNCVGLMKQPVGW